MKTREDKFSRVNNLYYDEFGRPNGILLVNKPAGMSSHDVVNITRKDLSFKKVGHAGALDVFASGLLLVLVGRATKLSNDFLNKDKAYVTRVVFGVKTTTQDPEGQIIATDKEIILDEEKITNVLKSFEGGYEQFVSIFSSVKVNGKKLRKVLREPNWSYELIITEAGRTIRLTNNNESENQYNIEVPKRKIIIYEIKLIEFGKICGNELPFLDLDVQQEFYYADIYVKTSKGTYIRQLGEDIAERLGTIGALASLDRVELAEWSKQEAIELEHIKDYSKKLESVSL